MIITRSEIPEMKCRAIPCLVLRFTPLAIIFLLFASPIRAGDATPQSRLAALQSRVAKRDFAGDKLRLDLVAFTRQQVGMLHYLAAIDILRHVPSPLDALDAREIDAEDRKMLALPDIVAYFRAHGRAVAHIAFNSDSSLVATSGWDNVVHLHKLGGKEPVSFAKIDGSPSGIAFHPDGKLLATGCGDTRVIVWNLSTNPPKEEYRLSGHKNRPFVVAYSPTGKMFASGCYDPVLRVLKFDDPNPEVWAVLANEKTVSLGIASLAFSHDGKHLVAGSHIGKESLRVWEVSGKFLNEKTLNAFRARTVACSPTEPIFAFAGDDETVQLMRIGAERVEKLHAIRAHTGKNLPPIVKALAFAPDGRNLATAGQDKQVRLWSVTTGKQSAMWTLPIEPRALAFASDGRHLAIVAGDGTVLVLRLGALLPARP
ncbi:MAG: hypothetical protein EXS16_15050 [Gemmataceae bacterium]|nr:hypothetical protein [Gemmataceae bacterium]